VNGGRGRQFEKNSEGNQELIRFDRRGKKAIAVSAGERRL